MTNNTARLVLKLFGMGILDSTLYCTKWWAKDIDEAIGKPEVLPHALDFFGYATTIVGGGTTGTVLYMAFRSGALLTVADPSNAGMRISFALFIASVAGAFTSRSRIGSSLQSRKYSRRRDKAKPNKEEEQMGAHLDL